MSEKKNHKNQVKICKREIKLSNYAVRGFMRGQDYMPGSYRKLQTTRIWSIAKERLLFYHEIKNITLICFHCGREVESTPVLHHKKYNWNKLFNPKYVEFVHQECHSSIHSTRRGYKRRIRFSYYQIKMLVVLISVILILIIYSISN
ncbi:hypothetical protein LCGC14_1205440 [marine sediment metagenome]|uniref:HNH domain-containing protein n=1 Tax=marine sediment metagenome TaxID=412755 RepID=A0A0F9PKC0_9ZZZZ